MMRINNYYYISIVIKHRNGRIMLITLSVGRTRSFKVKKLDIFKVQQAFIAIVFIYYTSVLVRSCAARFFERDTKEFSSRSWERQNKFDLV